MVLFIPDSIQQVKCFLHCTKINQKCTLFCLKTYAEPMSKNKSSCWQPSKIDLSASLGNENSDVAVVFHKLTRTVTLGPVVVEEEQCFIYQRALRHPRNFIKELSDELPASRVEWQSTETHHFCIGDQMYYKQNAGSSEMEDRECGVFKAIGEHDCKHS